MANSSAFFYPVAIIPTIFDYHDPDVDSSESISRPSYEDERKHRVLKPEVIKEFDLNSQGMDFTPLYFDFKIAKNASTATKLLESLVSPPPSRRALTLAEACYNES